MESLEANSSSSKARSQLLVLTVLFGAVVLIWSTRNGISLSRWLSGWWGLALVLALCLVTAKLLSKGERTETDEAPSLRINKDGIEDNRLDVFIPWKDIESVRRYSNQEQGIRSELLYLDLENEKRYLGQISVVRWITFKMAECDFMIDLTYLDVDPNAVEQGAKSFLEEAREAP